MAKTTVTRPISPSRRRAERPAPACHGHRLVFDDQGVQHHIPPSGLWSENARARLFAGRLLAWNLAQGLLVLALMGGVLLLGEAGKRLVRLQAGG